jgi:hypothetical protein
VQQPIEDGCCDDRVAEDRSSLGVAFVQCEDDRASFVTCADELEEDGAAEIVQRYIAHFGLAILAAGLGDAFGAVSGWYSEGMVKDTGPIPEGELVKLSAGNQVGKIHPLTSLRFFAALLVVCFHAMPRVIPGFTPDRFGGKVITIGNVAVSFFFLLSGYILAVVYLRGEAPLNRRKFWNARFARVYPLFLVTLVLDTPNLLLPRIAQNGLEAGVLKTGVNFVGCLAMLQAWIPILGGIDGPNWSRLCAAG